MDCASCVAKVTKAVERLPGVSDVAVNLMAERLTATLADPAGAAAVERQVATLGYKATRLDAPPATTSFPIISATPASVAPATLAWRVEGMDCASCVAKVEGALQRLPGVSDIAVNLMAERLTLRLAPGGRRGHH
ncbi:cation transporter [Paeniroseomonas aquatica]|uniref:cation transporter n=1 Tax=Paeniroseomonas aquatica TaxID=373043 RepID=UPI0036204429